METQILALTLYRGLNGTNPSAFRIDEDGISVFENPLLDYKHNVPIPIFYEGEKVLGVIAEIIEPMLKGDVAGSRRNSGLVIGRCDFQIWRRKTLDIIGNKQKVKNYSLFTIHYSLFFNEYQLIVNSEQ